MFGKRSRKKNSCRANCLFVFRSRFHFHLSSRPKAELGGGRMALFPERTCQRFTSERGEGNKGEKWRREYRERRDIGRIDLREGTLRIRRVFGHARRRIRGEPSPRHVSISRPRIAPRRRNVTRKRADPRSTDALFD